MQTLQCKSHTQQLKPAAVQLLRQGAWQWQKGRGITHRVKLPWLPSCPAVWTIIFRIREGFWEAVIIKRTGAKLRPWLSWLQISHSRDGASVFLSVSLSLLYIILLITETSWSFHLLLAVPRPLKPPPPQPHFKEMVLLCTNQPFCLILRWQWLQQAHWCSTLLLERDFLFVCCSTLMAFPVHSRLDSN